MDTRLKALGERIARLQDRDLSHRPKASLEAHLASLGAARRVRERSRARTVFAARALAATTLLLAVVATAALVSPPRSKTPLSFEVGNAREHGSVGQWLAANNRDDLLVHFSDDSSVHVMADGRARVASITENGAELFVERGRVAFDVVPRRDEHWVVAVGPFRIEVKGTRFETLWDPVAEVLTLSMDEGRVAVTGPCLTGPRSVGAGETVRMSCRNAKDSEGGGLTDPRAPEDTPDSPPADADADNAALPAAPHAPIVKPPPTNETPEKASDAAPERSWRNLIAEEDYVGALAAAEHSDFERELQRASPEDLLRLGNASRFARKSARATEVYLELRRRAPHTEFATTAAFHLGRIAFDDRADFTDARRWFSSYLEESPNGSLAQETLGRLCETEERAGNHGAAKTTAQRYLARFPRGPHAGMAERIVQGEPIK